MPLRRRTSPQGANGREDWLVTDEDDRQRPWAYEELLFGSRGERERARELALLVDQIEAERRAVEGLHDKLDARLARISALDRKLRELSSADDGGGDGETVLPTLPHTRPGSPEGPIDAPALDRLGYLLSRCEGFDVESEDGAVGYVEGLRFGSRIDRPDLLEVRGGRLGRQLLLVPIEHVAEIRIAEQRVLLSTTPALASDLLHDLGDRLRRALHHLDQTAS